MSPKTKLKKLSQVRDESNLKAQLEELQLRDDFRIRRSLKYTMLFVVIVVIIFLAIIFMREMIINLDFREAVLNLLKDNITAIVVAALAFLGFNLKSNSKNS